MFTKRNIIIIFSFISLFISINNQDCSSTTPLVKYDCFKYSTAEEYCCFNSSKRECSFINKNEIKNNPGMDCGISEDNYGFYEFEEYHPRHDLELPFLSCGEKNPKKKMDCLEYSEITNSCCFFKDNSGKSACYYIGRRYSGDLKEKSFDYEGNQITYECNSFYAITNFYFIFFLVFLFF